VAEAIFMLDNTQEYEAHPVAAIFPMLPQEDLEELAADIKQRGLIYPIIIDGDQIIDGRNRLAACKIAKVEPSFAAYEGDDITGFIMASNINRRHLTKGQQAMILVKCQESWHSSPKNIAKENNLSRERLRQAQLVSQHAPDLVDEVINGVRGLDNAYGVAQERKQEAEAREVRIEKMRQHQIDLQELLATGAEEDEAFDELDRLEEVAKRDEEEHEALLERERDRLRSLIIGWISLTALPANDDRTDILAGMSDIDRLRIESIENLFVNRTTEDTWEGEDDDIAA